MNHGWGFVQGTPNLQILGILNDHLDAEHAFAFAIDLQDQLAVMDLEYSQVIGKCLDHDSPTAGVLFAAAAMGPITITEYGLDAVQVQDSAIPIDERLEHLLQLAAGLKP